MRTTVVTSWRVKAAFYLHGVLRAVARDVTAKSERDAVSLAGRALALAGATDVLHLSAEAAS